MIFIYFITNKETQECPTLSQEDVNTSIHRYLMKNPEAILESLEKIKRKKIAEEEVEATKFISENMDVIEAYSPIWPLKGKIVVFFYDYSCPHCKEICLLLSKIENIKIIYKPLCFYSKSQYISEVMLSLYQIKPTAFFPINNIIMSSKYIDIQKILSQHNVSQADINKKLDSGLCWLLLNKNKELAEILHIDRIPAFIIDGKVYTDISVIKDLL